MKSIYPEKEKIIRSVRSYRYVLTIILALIAVGIEYYYSICEGSCSYLRGDIFGIELQYVGIAFMVCVIALSILKKDILLLVLLSAGVGVEIYLVGFQIWHSMYCVYCLSFGSVLVVQFLVNADWKRRKLILASVLVAMLFFPIFFSGSATPAYAADEVSLPAFGQGTVKVRFYADYFCGPCRAIEPKIEPVLTELVKRNVITLTFIDTPFYRYSSMYARYFLYAVQEAKDIESAIAARRVLFATGTENISDDTQLEEVLKNKGIKFRVFDAKTVFTLYGMQLRNDNIEATPSCVIERDGKKEVAKGNGDVIAALEKLLK